MSRPCSSSKAELVVRNLPPDVTADEIRAFWSNFGCTSVHLEDDKRCAYLAFATGKDYQSALEVARDSKSPLYMNSNVARFRLFCTEVRGRLHAKQPSQGSASEPSPSKAARSPLPQTPSRMAVDDLCQGCKRPASGQVVCGGCRFVIYCDVSCQHSNWFLHRQICQHLSICQNESSDPFFCYACDNAFITVGDRVPVVVPCGHLFCQSCVNDAPSGCARAECPASSSPPMPQDEVKALRPALALTELISRQTELRTTPPREHQRNLVALLQRQRGRLSLQLSRVCEELEQEERVLAELNEQGGYCSDASLDTTAESAPASPAPAAAATAPPASTPDFKTRGQRLRSEENAGGLIHEARDLGELKLLLKRWAGNAAVLNWKGKRGDTVLIANCSWGRLGVVKALCSTPGVDLNGKNSFGSTALMKACYHGMKDVVEYLANLPGVDVRAKDCMGKTALTQSGELQIIPTTISN